MKSDSTFPLPAAGPIVLIVRHADIEIPRTAKDPPITPRGKLRAEELLRIAAVFCEFRNVYKSSLRNRGKAHAADSGTTFTRNRGCGHCD
jgi:hypothetical protein